MQARGCPIGIQMKDKLIIEDKHIAPLIVIVSGLLFILGMSMFI